MGAEPSDRDLLRSFIVGLTTDRRDELRRYLLGGPYDVPIASDLLGELRRSFGADLPADAPSVPFSPFVLTPAGRLAICDGEGHTLHVIARPTGCRELVCVDISHENLAGAWLPGALFSYVYAGGANLTGANLTGAHLLEAGLMGANLSHATLTGANLTGANLSDANLTGANLSGANLAHANLAHANLAGVSLNWNSHNLIGAVLMSAARDWPERRFASAVGAMTDVCWQGWALYAEADGVATWALDTLARYVAPGDDGSWPPDGRGAWRAPVIVARHAALLRAAGVMQ